MEWRWLDNDLIRKKLKGLDCILCLEGSAGFLGLSNQSMTNRIQVYSVNPINEDGIECILVESYDGIEYEVNDDLRYTTPEQTLIDLLKYDRSVQTILEALSNYYFKHGESFETLLPVLPEALMETFEKYKTDAIEYYNE